MMTTESPANGESRFKLYVLEKEPVERVCRELDMTANQVYKIKWRLTQKLDEKMKALLKGSES